MWTLLARNRNVPHFDLCCGGKKQCKGISRGHSLLSNYELISTLDIVYRAVMVTTSALSSLAQ